MLRDRRNERAAVGAKRKRSMLVMVFLQPSRSTMMGRFIGGTGGALSEPEIFGILGWKKGVGWKRDILDLAFGRPWE